MRKAITMESSREETHSSTRMTKDATGTAFTAPITGATSSRTARQRLASAASTTPRASAARKPRAIRPKESATDAQNSPVATSSARRASTCEGPTRMILRSMARAASSQAASQKATAARRAAHARSRPPPWGPRFFSPRIRRYAP